LGFGPYCREAVPKFRCFWLVVLSFSSTMLQMVIPSVWALPSTSCLKVSLFFSGSFKVDF